MGHWFLPGGALISSVGFYGQVHLGGDPGHPGGIRSHGWSGKTFTFPKRIWWKWQDQGGLGLPHYPPPLPDWDQDERRENKVGKDEFLMLLLVLFLLNGSSSSAGSSTPSLMCLGCSVKAFMLEEILFFTGNSSRKLYI